MNLLFALILVFAPIPPARTLYVLEWHSQLPLVSVTATVEGGTLASILTAQDGMTGWVEADAPKACLTIRAEGKTASGILVHFARSWQDACGVRLLVLGDSIAYGLQASAPDRLFRAQLADALGASLTFTRTTTVDDIPAQIPPSDVIVLEIGLNDATLQLIPESDWPAAYGAALDRLKTTGAQVVAATTFPVFAPSNEHYATVARYAQYIRAEAAARGIPVADLWAIDCCISQPDEPSMFPPGYHGDGYHPDDAGHARIAYALLRAIRPRAVYAPFMTKPTPR